MVATVFKTAEPYVNRAVGGFDSHTLPPFKEEKPRFKAGFLLSMSVAISLKEHADIS